MTIEMRSVIHEIRNGMYRPFSYALATTMVQVPMLLVLGFAINVLTFAVGGWPWHNFVTFVLQYTCSLLVFESFTQLIVVAFPNPIIGILAFLLCPATLTAPFPQPPGLSKGAWGVQGHRLGHRLASAARNAEGPTCGSLTSPSTVACLLRLNLKMFGTQPLGIGALPSFSVESSSAGATSSGPFVYYSTCALAAGFQIFGR